MKSVVVFCGSTDVLGEHPKIGCRPPSQLETGLGRLVDKVRRWIQALLVPKKRPSGGGNCRKNERRLPLEKNLEMGMLRRGHFGGQIIRPLGFVMRWLVAVMMKARQAQMDLGMLHVS